MKYTRSQRFIREYQALSDANKLLAKRAARALSDYFDERSKSGDAVPPADIRLRKMQGAKGVFEITWSFARPDGRMTFSLLRDSVSGEPIVYWRRCGGHDIYKDP